MRALDDGGSHCIVPHLSHDQQNEPWFFVAFFKCRINDAKEERCWKDIQLKGTCEVSLASNLGCLAAEFHFNLIS